MVLIQPSTLREIRIAPGRILRVTPVFASYWRFAYERQRIFMRRVRGEEPQWTDDPILREHRFTNVYRASDRVSQYLIHDVIYSGSQEPEEVFFRTLLFKFFNRVDTWERLTRAVGPIEWRTFNVERYSSALDAALNSRDRVYSAAYIMPSPNFGEERKHRNHLRLLEHMMKTHAPQRVADAPSLEDVFRVLRSYTYLGDFLAFQFTIDLNYGPVINFSENDFVVAGPGARDGIKKCFADTAGLSEEGCIRAVTELADREFEELGLKFDEINLWGRKLHLIDCQNLFCEVDKYARVKHPEWPGASGRTRIKQRFAADPRPLLQWYPPKWNLVVPPPLMAPAPGSTAPTASARVPLVTKRRNQVQQAAFSFDQPQK